MQLRALIPKLGNNEADPFDKPIDFGEPELDGKSIAQLIAGQARLSRRSKAWTSRSGTPSATSCHAGPRRALCDQAKT
jgi:hypothetical protein